MNNTKIDLSEVQNFYSGQCIFLTGVTGFLGKALLEKLLRSCPQLKTVYVLMRPKKNVDINTRLENIFHLPMFSVLKESFPDAFTKVHAVEGDIGVEDLGLKADDRSLICQNVSIVIHSAANIRFNEPLKAAMNINYNGAQRILNLCQDLQDLKALVHISTAYSNCDHPEIKEECMAPKNILREIDTLSDEFVNNITPMIIGKKPNTYTYSKSMAEYLLQEHGKGLPICIIRPSIIGSSWKEPQEGFVDNLNGISGVVAAIGKGVLSTMNCKKNLVIDVIPLDVVVNLIIASAWDTANATNVSGEIVVYNCCSGTLNPLTYRDLRVYTLTSCADVPFDNVLFYPNVVMISNATLYTIINTLFTFIPFILLDSLSVILGKRPKLIKTYYKVDNMMSALRYFCLNEWTFRTDNMVSLQNRMGEKDQEIFFMNIDQLNWIQYIQNSVLGIKKYIFKEDLALSSSNRLPMTGVCGLLSFIIVIPVILILQLFC